jgi:hypothetical protein
MAQGRNLEGMKKEIGEKAIELNQDASGDEHPNGQNHRGSRKIANHRKAPKTT